MQLRSYEYRRLHDACLHMALRSNSENMDRWLKMARACLDRAGGAEMIEHSSTTRTVTVEFAVAHFGLNPPQGRQC